MSDPLGRGWTSDRHRELNQKEAMERLQSSLREAQEAAEEYWEAWQESASFCEILAELNEEWRKKVERLESKLDTSRVANRLRQRRLDAAAAERDHLREALKKYGAHDRECPLADSIARLRGVVPCACGLVDLLEKNN